MLLVPATDGNLRLWDLAAGRDVHRFPALGQPCAIHFSPGGCYAAVGIPGAVVVLRLPDLPALETVVKPVEVQRFEGYPSDAPHFPFLSPDGRLLVTVPLTGTGDCDLQLWDVTTGQKHHALKGHRAQVFGVAFSPDCKRLATGGSQPDATVRIWDVESGRQELVCWHVGPEGRDRSGWVSEVAFAPDGKTVFSSGMEGSVRQWDVETGQEVKRFGGSSTYRCLAVSRDGCLIASGSAGSRGAHGIVVWDVKSGKEVQRFEGHAPPGYEGVTTVGFSQEGKRILSIGYDSAVRVWDLESGKAVRELEDVGVNDTFRSTRPRGIAWTPDGRTILGVTRDNRAIRRWDAETGEELPRLTDPRLFGVGARVELLRGGRFAVCVFADNTARLWRLPDPPTPQEAGSAEEP
jgi:hypothetical protein